jgi:hypothetical protein
VQVGHVIGMHSFTLGLRHALAHQLLTSTLQYLSNSIKDAPSSSSISTSRRRSPVFSSARCDINPSHQIGMEKASASAERHNGIIIILQDPGPHDSKSSYGWQNLMGVVFGAAITVNDSTILHAAWQRTCILLRAVCVCARARVLAFVHARVRV